MGQVRVDILDHLGVIASVIKSSGLIAVSIRGARRQVPEWQNATSSRLRH